MVTRYEVSAATAYTDVKVETLTLVSVPPADSTGDGDETEFVPEVTVTGLTNGLVYSFQVVATNAFGKSPTSLPSNKARENERAKRLACD